MDSSELKDREECESENRLDNQLGRRAQVGGALAAFIGILLLVFGPAPVPGSPLDLHQMAKVFIVVGVFLIASGTLARWYYLKRR